MISICIPTYNYDINALINVLLNEAQSLDFDVEILVIDDKSSTKFQKTNLGVKQNALVNFLALEENIGYSKIRNLFLSKAKYDYLLYMDADTLPVESDFIKKYYEGLKKGALIYGGVKYLDQKPKSSHLLRWKYGTNRECNPVDVRKLNPYGIFISMSFLVDKDILSRFPFDEQLTQYGHEDTLLAYRLKQHKIPLVHIDNPVYHLNLDSNKQFLRKVELAVESLVFVRQKEGPGFNKMVRLLYMGCTIQKNNLSWLVKGIFKLSKPFLKLNLISPFPILYLLDFYKLGYLLEISSQSELNICQ